LYLFSNFIHYINLKLISEQFKWLIQVGCP